jgi:toxin ParE1/3/4
VSELRELAEGLQSFPERGSVPKELEATGSPEFRQLVRPPYRLFYAVTEHEVLILLIADGRRDMQTLLRQRLLSR